MRCARLRPGVSGVRSPLAAVALTAVSLSALAIIGCATHASADAGEASRNQWRPGPNAGVVGEWIVTLDRGDPGADGASTLTMLKLPIPDVASGTDAYVEVRQGTVQCQGTECGEQLRVSHDGAWALVPLGADSGVLQLASLAGPEPAVIDTIDFGSPLGKVSWRHDDALVAVALPEDEGIAICEVASTGFGEPTHWPMPGVRPNAVEWSPSGRHIAVLSDGVIPVGFFGVRGDGGRSMGLRRITVDLSALPIEGVSLRHGHWTPNEGSLIVFGESVGGGDVDHPAAVSIVSFDASDGGRWLGGFNIAGAAAASAMSPAGDLLAVITMDFKQGAGGAISLFRVDPSTGALQVADQVAVEGPPSAITFDREGSTLLTTDIENNLVRVWRIRRDGRALQLVDTGLEVETGVAPLAVAVVP